MSDPSKKDPAQQYWRDMAEQRGLLLHDMTDKWAERRVEFLRTKRAMSEKLSDSRLRERILTRRIAELEKTVRIVWDLMRGEGPSETRVASMYPYVRQAIGADAETGAVNKEER